MAEAATSQSSTDQGQQAAAGVQQAVAASTQTQTSQGSSQTTAPTRPDYVPEAFWDAATGVKHKEFGEHYTGLAMRLAADEVRRNALPKTVADYKMDLPKEFKLPEGMKWEWKTDAPEFGKFKEVALKHQWSQDAVTDALGIFAEVQVGSDAQYQHALASEREKLGANGTARVTAIETWLNGIVGPENAAELKKVMITAGAVKAIEQIITKHSSQGAASFRQDGREPGGAGGKFSAEQWAAMSPAERWEHRLPAPNGAGR